MSTDIKRRKLDGKYELVICMPLTEIFPDEYGGDDTFQPFHATKWVTVAVSHDPDMLQAERNEWRNGKRGVQVAT